MDIYDRECIFGSRPHGIRRGNAPNQMASTRPYYPKTTVSLTIFRGVSGI